MKLQYSLPVNLIADGQNNIYHRRAKATGFSIIQQRSNRRYDERRPQQRSGAALRCGWSSSEVSKFHRI